MPLDTHQKRLSALNVGSPWRGLLPLPTGTVDGPARATVALHYSGIAAQDEPTVLRYPHPIIYAS